MALYEYDGREFTSIKKLSEYVGIYEKTLGARLRRGMTVEEACEASDLRCRYFRTDGEEKSVSQICAEQDKDRDLVCNRLKRGYTIEEALNTPKKIARQGSPIVVNGILYKSVSSALERLDLSDRESAVRHRLRCGMSPDEAFRFVDGETRNGNPIVVNGVYYNSISSAIKRLGLMHKNSIIRRRLKNGMSPDEAFSFPEGNKHKNGG